MIALALCGLLPSLPPVWPLICGKITSILPAAVLATTILTASVRHRLAELTGETIARAETNCYWILAALGFANIASSALSFASDYAPVMGASASGIAGLDTSVVVVVVGTVLILLVLLIRLIGLYSPRMALRVLANHCTITSGEDCLSRIAQTASSALDASDSSSVGPTICAAFDSISRSARRVMHLETFLDEASSLRFELADLKGVHRLPRQFRAAKQKFLVDKALSVASGSTHTTFCAFVRCLTTLARHDRVKESGYLAPVFDACKAIASGGSGVAALCECTDGGGVMDVLQLLRDLAGTALGSHIWPDVGRAMDVLGCIGIECASSGQLNMAWSTVTFIRESSSSLIAADPTIAGELATAHKRLTEIAAALRLRGRLFPEEEWEGLTATRMADMATEHCNLLQHELQARNAGRELVGIHRHQSSLQKALAQ